MTRNYDDRSDDKEELSPGFAANPIDKNQRHEPRFSGFDDNDEDDYEEPDRDTDYTSGYRADSVEEEDTFPDEEVDEIDNRPSTVECAAAQQRFEPPVAEEPDEWLEKEGYEELDEDPKWPLSLIVVAIVALVLLSAGGYGVMQQRAATEEELRQLRAALATTASPENVSASRVALQNLQQSYDKLAANAEALTLENRRLTDTVAGLEAQLGVQQAVLTKTVPAANQTRSATADAAPPSRPVKPPAPAPEPVSEPVAAKATAAAPVAVRTAAPEPAVPELAVPKLAVPEPTAPKPATTRSATSSGPWFVNFGSYATRAMADTWATRLHPNRGEVIVAANTRDGKTLYRVRVVGLDSRNSAMDVARTLESELRVSALWVGKD